MIRRFAQGAEIGPNGTSFRVWAPACAKVELVVEGRESFSRPMLPEDRGYFSVLAPVGAGTSYRFRLDDGGEAFPDPASRFQSEGPHGPSSVIDPHRFAWTDAMWSCAPFAEQVIYEMHIGTFTPQGTWAAAAQALPALVDLGVTLLEIMPIAEFPGRFGWGYDGVDWYAPAHIYGDPDDARGFVDRAHALGLGVMLDVVYNHLGPSGNVLPKYGRHFFTRKNVTDWGDPINYDGEESHGVRSLVVDNAAFWIEEFHFDGLRLDATQNIYDTSKPHILAEIVRAARSAGGSRRILIVAENESQDAKLARPVDAGGYGIDALWNDDYHHAAVVALTGHKEAYYSDYQGTPQELVSAMGHGYLYQGQRYPWQKRRRGHPALDLPRSAFVSFLENHDQVANSGDGARLCRKASPARWRAMTALTLLGPATPMLFQGQEYGSSAPFLFFAEHDAELNAKIRAGRGRFLKQFPSLASEDAQARIADPSDPDTFRRCKLDPADREANLPLFSMHRSLIRLRRTDPRILSPVQFDGAILSTNAFCLRWHSALHGDLLALINLGSDMEITHPSEPLLAPLGGSSWNVIWSSEEAAWGGSGIVLPEDEEGKWLLGAETFTLLSSLPSESAG